MKPQFVLASGSEARAQILESLGVKFTVHTSDFDEDNYHECSPKIRAEHLAREKALVVHQQFEDAYIIGGDSLIESATGELYEKPASKEQARQMLISYRNSHCISHSGMAIVAPDGTVHSAVHSTTIYWGNIPDAQLQSWLQAEVWKGRSGGFKLSGIGQLLAKDIEGETSSVSGFPIYVFGQLLQKHGLAIEEVATFRY